MKSEQNTHTSSDSRPPMSFELEDTHVRNNCEPGQVHDNKTHLLPNPHSPPIYKELTEAAPKAQENVYRQSPSRRPEVQDSLKPSRIGHIICTVLVTTLVVATIATLVCVFGSHCQKSGEYIEFNKR